MKIYTLIKPTTNILADSKKVFAPIKSGTNTVTSPSNEIIENHFLNNKLVKTILQKFITQENCIGEGGSGNVFKIPQIQDYVIKIMNRASKIDFVNETIINTKDIAPTKNFGQPIAKSISGFIEILKPVIGENNTIPNYIQKNINPSLITDADTKMFLKKMNIKASFPLQSYIQMCEDVKYINLNLEDFKFDHFNCSNLLIDNVRQRFNIIDLAKNQELPKLFKLYKPGYDAIISMLLDHELHNHIIQRVATESQNDLIRAGNQIIDKVTKAAEITGLETSNFPLPKIYSLLDEYIVKYRGKKARLADGFAELCELYPKLGEINKK